MDRYIKCSFPRTDVTSQTSFVDRKTVQCGKDGDSFSREGVAPEAGCRGVPPEGALRDAESGAGQAGASRQ